jgi:hypothetical protein
MEAAHSLENTLVKDHQLPKKLDLLQVAALGNFHHGEVWASQ